MDGTVEKVATAKHVKFVLAANAVADERAKKVAELLGLLECCDVIRRLILPVAVHQYGRHGACDNTTPRLKDEEQVGKDDVPLWDELTESVVRLPFNLITGNAYGRLVDFSGFPMELRTRELFGDVWFAGHGPCL